MSEVVITVRGEHEARVAPEEGVVRLSVRAVKVAVDPSASPPLRFTVGLAPQTETDSQRGSDRVPSALRLCTCSD